MVLNACFYCASDLLNGYFGCAHVEISIAHSIVMYIGWSVLPVGMGGVRTEPSPGSTIAVACVRLLGGACGIPFRVT